VAGAKLMFIWVKVGVIGETGTDDWEGVDGDGDEWRGGESMTTGEEGLDSLLTRCFFSLIMDLARSYIDIFGLDGVMDLGVGGRETGESGDDEGVERISGGGIEGIDGMDGDVEGSVGGIKGGCWIRTAGGVGGIKGGGWEIRTVGGVGGIKGGGAEGIESDGEMWIEESNGGGTGEANGGDWEIRIGEEHFETVIGGVDPRTSSLWAILNFCCSQSICCSNIEIVVRAFKKFLQIGPQTASDVTPSFFAILATYSSPLVHIL
jgi:hypothetical protein